MVPVFDPRPWGTLDLSPIYPNHRCEEKIGEAWLTGNDCKVANGPLQGRTLSELCAEHGQALVGQTSPSETQFPLLLKFLFPQEKLSVQVHPDDQAAQKAGLPNGKTECWYVAHAKPGAQIALGLKPGVTHARFEQSIHEKRAEELLNWINVFNGEMIYVAGGTVHTLGPGSIIVETQQQSDTTYRLYDYGRARELHLKDGLAVIKEKVPSGKTLRPAPAKLNGSENQRSPLIAAPNFVVDMYDLKTPQMFSMEDSSRKSAVQILVAVEGCALVETSGNEPVMLTKGDAVVVPAFLGGFTVRPQWQVKFLKSYVPGTTLPEPETRL